MGISYTGKINKIKGTKHLPPQAIDKHYPSIYKDPYLNSVVMLLKFNDNLDSTTSGIIADTNYTTASLDSTHTKFGSNALLLNSTSWVSYDYNPLFDLADNDFTMELWGYFPTNTIFPTGGSTLFSTYTALGDDSFSLMYNNNAVYLWLSTDGTTTNIEGYGYTPVVTFDDWNHIAVSRKGNKVYFFCNGVLGDTITLPDNYIVNQSTNNINIGRISPKQVPYTYHEFGSNVWIDEIRFTNGYGRYTESFTLPTVEFPVI